MMQRNVRKYQRAVNKEKGNLGPKFGPTGVFPSNKITTPQAASLQAAPLFAVPAGDGTTMLASYIPLSSLDFSELRKIN